MLAPRKKSYDQLKQHIKKQRHYFAHKGPFSQKKVKEEIGKVGLKLNVQKTKIMVSGPIISWQIDGETMETVRDFIFLGSKITVDETAAMKLKDACFLEEKL